MTQKKDSVEEACMEGVRGVWGGKGVGGRGCETGKGDLITGLESVNSTPFHPLFIHNKPRAVFG
jgi:hypothetical protein